MTTDCWPHFHLSRDKYERLSSQFKGDGGNHAEYPNRCWLFRPGLPLQIISHANLETVDIEDDAETSFTLKNKRKQYLYRSPNTVWVIKYRLRWARHVAEWVQRCHWNVSLEPRNVEAPV